MSHGNNRRWSRRIAGGLGMLAVLGLLTAPAPGKTLEPMVLGWEQIFKLDWQATADKGRPMVQGYLVNDSPYTVHRIQILVDGLDAADNVVGQRVAWVPGTLTPFSRTYFSAPAPEGAKYRVRVFAFDRIEAPTRDR
jgi:hypothetical protein